MRVCLCFSVLSNEPYVVLVLVNVDDGAANASLPVSYLFGAQQQPSIWHHRYQWLKQVSSLHEDFAIWIVEVVEDPHMGRPLTVRQQDSARIKALYTIDGMSRWSDHRCRNADHRLRGGGPVLLGRNGNDLTMVSAFQNRCITSEFTVTIWSSAIAHRRHFWRAYNSETMLPFVNKCFVAEILVGKLWHFFNPDFWSAYKHDNFLGSVLNASTVVKWSLLMITTKAYLLSVLKTLSHFDGVGLSLGCMWIPWGFDL